LKLFRVLSAQCPARVCGGNKSSFMKVSKLLAILFGGALLLSSSAFAREANKSALHLSEKVTPQGKSINSGDYTVEWSGSGPAVQVTILQGKQTMATLSGRLTDQATSNPENAYGAHEGSDGSRSLTAIYYYCVINDGRNKLDSKEAVGAEIWRA
jgi:hypothetical protein